MISSACLICFFLFQLLFVQLIPECFQQDRSVVDALHADTGAAAADSPVSRTAVDMSVEVGVGHAPADVKRCMGEYEKFL